MRTTLTLPTLILPALMLCLAPAGVAWGQSSDVDRFRRELESWDKNGDGFVTEDEAGGREWYRLRRRADRYGQDRNADRYRIKSLVRGRQEREEREDRERRERRGEATAPSEPQARGFEPDTPEPAPAASFSPASSQRSGDRRGNDRDRDRRDDRENRGSSSERERAARYARGLLDRYDENKNRILERDEWRRISGSPEKADANGDGVITLEELTARLEYNYTKRDGGGSSESRSTGEQSSRSSGREDPQSERRSYRFKPPHERLPDGLPSWFRDRDQNGDGQVAMHEYSRSWSDSRAREFARYDGNGDGVITPAEAKRDR